MVGLLETDHTENTRLVAMGTFVAVAVLVMTVCFSPLPLSSTGCSYTLGIRWDGLISMHRVVSTADVDTSWVAVADGAVAVAAVVAMTKKMVHCFVLVGNTFRTLAML